MKTLFFITALLVQLSAFGQDTIFFDAEDVIEHCISVNLDSLFDSSYLGGWSIYNEDTTINYAAIMFSTPIKTDTMPYGTIEIDIETGAIFLDGDSVTCNPRLAAILFRVLMIGE